MKYLRIGTDYYKVVEKPTLNGTTNSTIIPWKRFTIVDDHGKEFLKDIPKYEGFTVQPSHCDYKKEVKGFYNKYMPLSHNITKEYDEYKFPVTLKFLQHIFGEQYEIGIDYLTILWQRPIQILPILCLVSDERNTGKTTFLNWLKLVFQDNMTINKNEDFRSRFNSDWSEKLIVAIDEVLLDRREDSERIKNLSTAAVYKTESKGKDKTETLFFGKFVLCSNNEHNFIFIDEKEIRYWIRKIPKLESSNPDLMEILEEELPMFISYINQRNVISPKKTRMWFTKEQIRTEALDVLVKGTKYSFEKEMILLLQEMFEDFEQESICLSYNDLINLFKETNQRVSRREISQLVVQKWKMEHQNSSYDFYYKTIDPKTSDWTMGTINKKGRYFRFEKDFINNR
ncbi:primase-helicase family protein [Aequorivita flava]|uniref:Primase-helicase family protein n=1 Tax=Aequorivita flava TaxID=3114371 RepID=A0AB35YUZ5_9FLAO